MALITITKITEGGISILRLESPEQVEDYTKGELE
jgi:hypothetical protein